MNLIDISSWQRGLNLSVLFDQNNLNGIIVKTSGGVSHKQDTCEAWLDWLIDNNKPFGFYHFLDDDLRHSSGKDEADFWFNNYRKYFGKGMPFADYEGVAKNHGVKYLKEFLDRIKELSNIKCGVYCSLSVINEQDFRDVANAGYPLWVAQYANYNVVNGFRDNPWQSGSVLPFKDYVMHQYTSMGYLNGWNGRLDFDLFKGTAQDWYDMIGNESIDRREVNPEIVNMVLRNELGTGNIRKQKLEELGYNYNEVQNKINELYGIALSCKRYTNGNDEYLNSICYIIRNL